MIHRVLLPYQQRALNAERENQRLRGELVDLRKAIGEYAAHQSWRCSYRKRYESCRCGLDETMAAFGLPPVSVQDPEDRHE